MVLTETEVMIQDREAMVWQFFSSTGEPEMLVLNSPQSIKLQSTWQKTGPEFHPLE
jgi:hypothetical protein